MDVFVDSSILVSRLIREKEFKEKINGFLSRCERRITGSVAVQEFNRRVLKDAVYLLVQLARTKSYLATLSRVTSVLPAAQGRKQRVCQLLLHQLLPGASDDDLTERARSYLRILVLYGKSDFLRGIELERGTNCFLATVRVREKRRYISYELGETKCAKTKGQCEIGMFLERKRDLCVGLLSFLEQLPPERKTDELTRAQNFLEKIISGSDVHGENACLTVGDLLLALESHEIPNFYTMNFRESQAFCDFLQQTLIFRPNNPQPADRVFSPSEKPWPYTP